MNNLVETSYYGVSVYGVSVWFKIQKNGYRQIADTRLTYAQIRVFLGSRDAIL